MARASIIHDVTDFSLLDADRWAGVSRPYTLADVERLRGSIKIEYTLADHGARRLWDLLTKRDYVPALGALTGNQATQMVKAGLEAIYMSGWQVPIRVSIPPTRCRRSSGA
jgi:isocitrate lyase